MPEPAAPLAGPTDAAAAAPPATGTVPSSPRSRVHAVRALPHALKENAVSVVVLAGNPGRRSRTPEPAQPVAAAPTGRRSGPALELADHGPVSVEPGSTGRVTR